MRQLAIFILFFIACSCNTEQSSNLAELTTSDITDITVNTAKSGGTIISDGGDKITNKGVCWNTLGEPTYEDFHTSDGGGAETYESILEDLDPGTEYFVRAYAVNMAGISYGAEKSFRTPELIASGQIIADHTIVDRFNDIPQYYIEQVKKMLLLVPGQSHSQGYMEGLKLLENMYPVFDVNVTETGGPEGYTTSHLRASRVTWGDFYEWSGWVYGYGEGSWFTNSTAIERTKSGITYCNTNGFEISAIGFGWCWDMIYGTPATTPDPELGVHWYGESGNGPDGNKAWGLDAGDYSQTGNSVSLDTYLNATQEYIDFCKSSGYKTKVFFTTGPVDLYYTGESGYQGSLKHERIREFVRKDTTRILFDFADILCYDDDANQRTATWNGHTYRIITTKNLEPAESFHYSDAGAVRLAKAMWWMLARIAGWDGK
jgi:hypothetical protein